MFTFLSLNKIALISIFSICAFTGAYTADAQNSNDVARAGDRGDRGFSDQHQYQDQNRYGGYRYGTGYGAYGTGYGTGVMYPQYYYGAPPNAQAFPDSAAFQNTYEQNQHPPR